MTPKSVTDYLNDLLKEIDDIIAFTLDGRATFEKDIKTQKAVVRSYEVIGEIAKRLPQSLRDEYDSIDWRRLIGFRDFLAHNYDRIVVRLLWEAIEDVPNLRQNIEAVIKDHSDGKHND